MNQIDTVFQAVIFHIDGRHFQRIQADIDRIDVRRRIVMRHLDGQAAAAGTQIQSRMHQLVILYPRAQRLAQQFVNKRTRHKHPFVHIKIKFALPSLIRQIRHRHTFVYPPLDQSQQAAFFRRQQNRVQIGFQQIQRQIQRVQDQISGFVVRIVAAVAERQPRLIETADGKAQHIAHGGKVSFGFFKHNLSGVILKTARIIPYFQTAFAPAATAQDKQTVVSRPLPLYNRRPRHPKDSPCCWHFPSTTSSS